MKRAAWALLPVALAVAALWLLRPGSPPLPADVVGVLVFVSDRSGVDSLYARRLPRGEARRLTATPEPVREPALAPDGGRVAFVTGGRLGLAWPATGEVRILTLGVDWRDASPSWRPDGRALVVSARRSAGSTAGLHLLELQGREGVVRHPLTQTRGLDDTSPAFSPDGQSVVFVREDNLFRIGLADGRTARLTGGFRKYRCPRFLPSGRIVCLWSQEKLYGLEVMDADGHNRETLAQGPVFYRTIAPSPDGRHLAATFTFDLGFHPTQALRLRQTEEVRLLDARGAEVATLERSWRYGSHSPDWGK